MSRTFDARQAALSAHPKDKESGVDLFLGYLGCNNEDFEYENNQTATQYIYGEENEQCK